MTTDNRFAPIGTDQRGQQPRYIRCARCNVLQPPSSQFAGQRFASRCVACGAPLQRWIAHPPPGGPRTVSRQAPLDRPYSGPPSYRGNHPRWVFPPVVWRDLPTPEPVAAPRDPTAALGWAKLAAALTAVLALVAAGAEVWRFVLMLDGRKLVLSGAAVRASDVLVAASGLAVLTAAAITAVLAVPALVRTHAFAAFRLGRAPSRTSRAVAARLLVPFWNIYGAGQIVTEIDRTLGAADRGDESAADRPLRASPLTTCWWLSWIVSAVLVMIALVRGLGGSLQAIADTVELHIAVDLAAAVVAGLAVFMLGRFRRMLTPRPSELDRWVVQPPAPTRAVAVTHTAR